MSDRLKRVDFVELEAEENARLDALDIDSATLALVSAMQRLAQQEADRIGVPFLDPTYHGCDPVWREALNATADLAHVVLGVEQWGVPRVTLEAASPPPNHPRGGH